MNLYHDLTVHATLARLERQNEAQAQIIDAQQRQIDLLEALLEVKYTPREVEHYPTVDLAVTVEDCR